MNDIATAPTMTAAPRVEDAIRCLTELLLVSELPNDAWNLAQDALAYLQGRPTPTDETIEGAIGEHPPGSIIVDSQPHLRDPKGRLVPCRTIEPFDLLMDETVRKVVGFAQTISAEVGRYRQHTLDDILGLQALLAQEFGVTIGGAKGNITLTSYDGLMKVTLKSADLTTFGPELQQAKSLVTECLMDWSTGIRPELRALLENAFQVDQQNRVNRGALLYLKRLRFDDDRWTRAMDAITRAERPMGTKEYVQVHVRPDAGAAWKHVTIDVAAA